MERHPTRLGENVRVAHGISSRPATRTPIITALLDGPEGHSGAQGGRQIGQCLIGTASDFRDSLAPDGAAMPAAGEPHAKGREPEVALPRLGLACVLTYASVKPGLIPQAQDAAP